MNREKAIVVLAISISSIIYIGCNSSSANRNNEKKKTTKPASIYNLGLSEEEEEKILKSSKTRQIRQEVAELMRLKLSPGSFSGAILVARKGVILYEHYQGLENH